MAVTDQGMLNQEKQQALMQLQSFVQASDEQVMVLTGYAGTGKTTLVRFLAQWCEQQEIPLCLLATTGRAAKVLSKKTGFNAETVHRLIYVLDTSVLDSASQSKRVTFKLNQNLAPDNQIYLIDESSMLSDKPLAEQALTLFGSGSLLSDLFFYAGKRKLIFVGDSAQLPPVNANSCPALSLDYLRSKWKVKGRAVHLKEVMRYADTKGITDNASALLSIISSGNFKAFLNIQASGHSNISVIEREDYWVRHYADCFRKKGNDSCIMLALSNKMTAQLNAAIRMELYGEEVSELVSGEWLMVQQNNYKIGVANGEHIKVLGVTGEAIKKAGLNFVPVDVEFQTHGGVRRQNVLLIRELLDSPLARLSNESDYLLTQDFMMRMQKKGIHPRRNSDEFMTHLLSDPYLNAIRARYGYAITCHKAQGGEWEQVYIMLERGLWNPSDIAFKFKWTYTAITRSEKNLVFLGNSVIV